MFCSLTSMEATTYSYSSSEATENSSLNLRGPFLLKHLIKLVKRYNAKGTDRAFCLLEGRFVMGFCSRGEGEK